ncbi:VOC family protein [Pseudonocardia bannensis]|uniref:VOC family protein n=2 Tax=Pseudonocardia bannensis TaxID=630973 RepID=A0A848DS37_9PSEU|nr:VOC family protein [Pseudonocardia bannensis]
MIAVAVDCHDSELLTAFWSRALGRGTVRRWADPRGLHYVQLDGEGPGAAALLFQPVAEPRAGKNRLHLDIAPSDGESQAGEVARLVALGARVVADEPDLPWVVLADPEGNTFCVLPPRTA